MSGSIFHSFVLDNAAGQETVVGIGSDSEKYGVGISSHVHVTGIGTFSDLLHTTGVIHAAGGIKDTSGNIGSSGKVLSSTGSGLQWIDPSEGSTANAVNVGTNLNSTNSDQFVAFMGATSGNNPVRVDAGIKYNPSSNLLTVGSITGSIAASNVNSGTLGVDRIPSLPASKITSGQLDAARIPTLNQNTTGNAATATSATTAATVTTAAQTNITSLGTLTGLTVNGNIIQSGTSNYIRINGALQDKDGQDGDSGQVLSSTGNQINWINVGDISAGSASQVAVSNETSDTTCFPLFVNAATGNQSPKSGTNLTFNSSTGALSATSFSGSIAASNINSGTVATARLGSGTANNSVFLRGDSTWATVTQTTINSNADNRIITGSGTANTLNAESSFTYNGSNLNVSNSGHLTQTLSATGDVTLELKADSDDSDETHNPIIKFTQDSNQNCLNIGIEGVGGSQFTGSTANWPYIHCTNAHGATLGLEIATNNVRRLIIDASGHTKPAADNTYNLGTSSLRWANIYSADLQLSNEGKTNDVDGTWGNYTIQEGESDLFLINNRSGKKYKFNLTEVN